jgi:hypothetical protein
VGTVPKLAPSSENLSLSILSMLAACGVLGGISRSLQRSRTQGCVVEGPKFSKQLRLLVTALHRPSLRVQGRVMMAHPPNTHTAQNTALPTRAPLCRYS